MRLSVLCLVAACATAPATRRADTNDYLLVANKKDATLFIVDLGTRAVVATLPTGVGPHEVTVSPDGRLAVVSDYGDKDHPGRTLTVVDVPGRKVARTIDLGEHRRPHGSAFLPDGRHVVVTVEVNEAVLVVDVIAGTVVRVIPTTQKVTHMVALGPDGRRAYTANIASGTVSALDLEAGRAVAVAPAAPQCEGIAVTPDGKEVWAGSNQDNVIVVLDAATLGKQAEIPAAGVPIRVAMTPDGRHALVANAMGSKIQVIDRARREVVKVIDLPAPDGADSAVPVGTLIDPDGGRAYIALVARDEVAIVDLASFAVIGTIKAGGGPDGMAFARIR